MIVFVHGAGLRGRDAWPALELDDALYPVLEGGVEKQGAAIAVLLTEPATLVAHSLGAVPAVRALGMAGAAVERLVLIEPALYDVARGDPAIEAHIAAMTRADALAASGDLWSFWGLVRPMMFGGPAERSQWDAERGRAEWFAAVPRPWGHGITAYFVAAQPTTVITGSWNDEYEAIAAALVVEGAEHLVLAGHDHRPQDHSEFPGIIASLVTASGR